MRTEHHGTRTEYRYWKCRCAECRAWNARRVALNRERHPRPRPSGWPAYNAKHPGGAPWGRAA